MFAELSSCNYLEQLNNANTGLILVFKKLCPHCRNMEKVVQKFLATDRDTVVFQLDIEEYPEVAAKFQAERPPTIIVFKNGRPVARKTGLMNPTELAQMYRNALQATPQPA